MGAQNPSPFIFGPSGAQNLQTNALSNNFIANYATTVTAAGTTTLTVNSAAIQYFTGTTTQTVALPVTSTLVTGYTFTITNNSTGVVTVQSSGGNTIISQAANTTALYTCILTTGTTAASWNGTYLGAGGANVPTVQKFLSGSGTYTTPSNVLYIQVEMAGGGGGGGASASNATPGTGGTGGSTTFGTSLLTANGGAGGSYSTSAGGAGGSASVNVSSTVLQLAALAGGSGAPGIDDALGSLASSIIIPGGAGGNNPFGGGGGGGNFSNSAFAGSANTGGGGGGAGVQPAASQPNYTGAGGGAGGYVKAIITNPSSTYSYSVGTGGSGGTAGTGGAAGASGGSGVIIVTEFYANGTVGTATTITGSVNSSQVLGTTAGGNASTGYIGEFVSSNPSSTVAVGASGAPVTITSISLTAGDWDVDGLVQFQGGGTTAATVLLGAVSLNPTSQDNGTQGGVVILTSNLSASTLQEFATGPRRINISTTTTVYLIGQLNYSTAGGAVWGTNSFIRARRVR